MASVCDISNTCEAVFSNDFLDDVSDDKSNFVGSINKDTTQTAATLRSQLWPGVEQRGLSTGVVSVTLVLFAMNICILASLTGVDKDKVFANVPADVWAGVLYMTAMVLVAFLIDAQALWSMFFDVKASPKQHPLPSMMGLGGNSVGHSLSFYVVILNWVAAVGVSSSALKLSMFNPVKNYEVVSAPTPQIAHDLFSGELELNALIRKGSGSYWETYYAHACCLYLIVYFLSLSAHRAGSAFDLRLYVQKGAIYVVSIIILGGFGGYLTSTKCFLFWLCLLMHGFLPVLFAFARRSMTAAVGEVQAQVGLPVAQQIMASMTLATVVAAIAVSALKSMPGAVDSDVNMVQHADPARGIHLQFCEEPYRYFSWASQGVALFFHMPYVPVILCIFSWRKMNCEIKILMAFQIPLQLWTGFGHLVPDPRVYKVTEVSIMIADLYFLQLIKVCSRFPKGFSISKAAIAYIANSFFVYNSFGLLTYILSQAITVPTLALMNPEIVTSLHLGALVSNSAKIVGSLLMALTAAIIITEGTFCQSLLAMYPLPYHSFFDLTFFQFASLFFLSIAISAQSKLDAKEA